MVRKANSNSVEQYVHDEQKRVNNPPVGLVTAETDKINGKVSYQFDPHLDPELQWAGKAEGMSFDVDSVSLHVHERIDPLTLIKAMRKKGVTEQARLFHFFETKENNPPIREAIEFYKHSQGWSNRLIAGDSLLVMNSLLEKEGMAGKVKMIYIDPPYGIKYGSNFQPFINKKDVKDGKDEDLTQEPETIKAFRDTWQLGIHSYITYLRNRFLLAKKLLSDSGSIFVQISDENLHHVHELMDEVFGHDNFAGLIVFVKTTGVSSKLLPGVTDYILWYGKNIEQLKSTGYHKLFKPLSTKTLNEQYNMFFDNEGNAHRLTEISHKEVEKMPLSCRFMPGDLSSQGYIESSSKPYIFDGKAYAVAQNRHYPNFENMDRLVAKKRVLPIGRRLRYVRYATDFPYEEIDNNWTDTGISGFGSPKIYVVQTSTKVIERCLLMTTNPGDLVLDPTCGSGTTAYVAEQWGRRWITCDTSRVSIALAKQRLMTAVFDYYALYNLNEGISSGFKYKIAPHITMHSIGTNELPKVETIYDQPIIDKSRKRVVGPFTVEAVPSQHVRSFDEIENDFQEADITISRSGETLRHNEWIDELLTTGIRGKGGQILEFVRIETISGTKWIQAKAETKVGKNAVISFGSEYAPLESRQVELAIEEAQELVPKPKIVLFVAFQFDPEAAKDIDTLKWPGVDVLKVQMNTDLLTSDLKKKPTNNQSFWLVGQPDVELVKKGSKYVVTVNGFDYYNTRTGEIESGDSSKIAMWELDTNYDGRSLYPRQVFFPMAGKRGGWNRLAKNLKAQINKELIEKYRGNVSVPFKLGENSQIAVKIIDDRGIESVKIIRVSK